ncbi:hypothetical protein PINS_up001386 [Pythium insidiosum]|nr:hypothetical protein PINS_up001386 [Pythium insidiosum]
MAARELIPSQPLSSGEGPKVTPEAASKPTEDVAENNNECAPPDALVRQGTADLSDAQRERAQLIEASVELAELCRDNGISNTQFAKRAAQIRSLEMFLGFWPSMKSVMHFPALRELSIVKHPTIIRIEGLTSCVSLESLCVSECGLEQIEGLDNCTKLRTLNLSGNRIQCMEPLARVVSLEVLWLNDNCIERLAGLWQAANLKSLWICRNRIERIDAALNGCTSLTELSMAENRISNFKTLLSLANLDQLSTLTLSDPHFGTNPVCRLCNYQTYVMCQLKNLTYLDTFELLPRNKQIADATMLKKKMYYNMRIKAIRKNVEHRIRHAAGIRQKAERQTEASISALIHHKKLIESALLGGTEIELDQSKRDMVVALKSKLERVEKTLREKVGLLSSMNRDFESTRRKLQWATDISISRLMLELDTGGNIRLEDGKPTDPWYSSCIELVRSRLCLDDLRVFGICDVKINRVTRVNNRHLRNRFHSRMEEILVVNAEKVKDNVSKKGVTVPVTDDTDGAEAKERPDKQMTYSVLAAENSLEYLFYGQPPALERMRRNELEQFYAAEHGFRDVEDYRAMGLDGAVKLSNSVSLVDTGRLLATVASKGIENHTGELPANEILRLSNLTVREQLREVQHEMTKEMREAINLAKSGEWEFPSSVLLVVKVFPGFTKTVTDAADIRSPIDRADFGSLHSLQVTRETVSKHPLLLTHQDEAMKQKMYYIFDKSLILPEYLVEYQYVSNQSDTKAPTASSSGITGVEKTETPVPTASSGGDIAEDLGYAARLVDDFERKYRTRRPPSPPFTEANDDSGLVHALNIEDDVAQVLQLDPKVTATSLVDSAPLPITRIKNTESRRLVCLDLSGLGLECVPDLSSLRGHLEVLLLSNNKLHTMESSLKELVRLKRLDVASNQLSRLGDLETLMTLTSVDASCNKLASLEDILSFGRCRGSVLKSIDLRSNPVCFTKRYRQLVLRHMPGLQELDQQKVRRSDVLFAESLITAISADVIWRHYIESNVCSLVGSKEPAANMPQYHNTGDPVWTAIEDIKLQGELIDSIDGLSPLINLRILILSDNVITRIDGIQACRRLEELSLDENRITRIENLDGLRSLKRLSLARNRITVVENLDRLENLTQLSLEDNHITSLRGFGNAPKLMELYLGNNRIEVLKEVQHLKTLPKLTILDVSGNDITQATDYRLYTIYYLRRVKVLDGETVSPQEQSDAKQKYGGKLTLDFIMEKHGNVSLDRIQELVLSSCRIRDLGSICGKVFPLLRELDLENNQISDITGMEGLPKLRVLNLNRNRIERLLPRASTAAGFASPAGCEGKGILSCPRLQELFLSYNQINDMTCLGLQHLDDLTVSDNFDTLCAHALMMPLVGTPPPRKFNRVPSSFGHSSTTCGAETG